MRITARQRRLERLAGAGGFFDGEGSTFARGESARPGYRQLNVVVPQSGGFVVLEALERFAEALPGLGRIEGPSGGMFYWRATDFTRSRAAVERLRPWIGKVKRDQARAAVAVVDEQYISGRYRRKAGTPPIGGHASPGIGFERLRPSTARSESRPLSCDDCTGSLASVVLIATGK
jgi:hypothetical protein